MNLTHCPFCQSPLIKEKYSVASGFKSHYSLMCSDLVVPNTTSHYICFYFKYPDILLEYAVEYNNNYYINAIVKAERTKINTSGALDSSVDDIVIKQYIPFTDIDTLFKKIQTIITFG